MDGSLLEEMEERFSCLHQEGVMINALRIRIFMAIIGPLSPMRTKDNILVLSVLILNIGIRTMIIMVMAILYVLSALNYNFVSFKNN